MFLRPDSLRDWGRQWLVTGAGAGGGAPGSSLSLLSRLCTAPGIPAHITTRAVTSIGHPDPGEMTGVTS